MSAVLPKEWTERIQQNFSLLSVLHKICLPDLLASIYLWFEPQPWSVSNGGSRLQSKGERAGGVAE